MVTAVTALGGRLPSTFKRVGESCPHRLNGLVLLRYDLALISTGTDRGGSSVSGGDSATDNEIMAPRPSSADASCVHHLHEAESFARRLSLRTTAAKSGPRGQTLVFKNVDIRTPFQRVQPPPARRWRAAVTGGKLDRWRVHRPSAGKPGSGIHRNPARAGDRIGTAPASSSYRGMPGTPAKRARCRQANARAHSRIQGRE